MASCLAGFHAFVFVDDINNEEGHVCLHYECQPGAEIGTTTCYDGGFSASCAEAWALEEFVP